MDEEHTTYREFDVIAVPEDVPEAGIRAGDTGAIVDMTGGILEVDVVEPETGRTLDVLYLDPSEAPPLKIVGRWRMNEG
jgi:hypothetical protein